MTGAALLGEVCIQAGLLLQAGPAGAKTSSRGSRSEQEEGSSSRSRTNIERGDRGRLRIFRGCPRVERAASLSLTQLVHDRADCGAEALHERVQVRSCAGMHDRQLLARLHGSRSPYDMQHGSEWRLLGRLLGPATMNTIASADEVVEVLETMLAAPEDAELQAPLPWCACVARAPQRLSHPYRARPVRARRVCRAATSPRPGAPTRHSYCVAPQHCNQVEPRC